MRKPKHTRSGDVDVVDEAGVESFPASDPPTWWAGPPRGQRELEHSQLFSEELGIDLASESDEELLKWFLASLLFGARIQQSVAARTYRALERHGLLTIEALLEAGHDVLVDTAMREGGYVRYDHSTADELLRAAAMLRDEYGGSLTRLHDEAVDEADLERRLAAFHGVGPVTVNIYLRELRPHWTKADPEPLPEVVDRARELGVRWPPGDRHTVAFARLEAGLIRSRYRSRPDSQ